MFNTILKKAIEAAEKGDHPVHRMGCVIFNGKSIISVGSNKCSTNRKKLHPKFQVWEGSVHAEANAILNAKTDLKGASLVVIRLNHRNQLMRSKPCHCCMSYLKYVGIKYVYFIENNYGSIVKCKISNKVNT